MILHEGRLVRTMDLGAEDEGDAVRLRLCAAGNAEKLKAALGRLECVTEVKSLPSGAGEAEFSLTCRRGDGNGRPEDRIFRLLAGMDAPVRRMTEERDTLEEVFLRETEGDAL